MDAAGPFTCEDLLLHRFGRALAEQTSRIDTLVAGRRTIAPGSRFSLARAGARYLCALEYELGRLSMLLTTDQVVLFATLLTALFTGWAVWQRWRYTPRPHWTRPLVARVVSSVENGHVLIEFKVMNVGDGDALNVEWSVRGAEVHSSRRNPRVSNGETHSVVLNLPTNATISTDVYGSPLPWVDGQKFETEGLELTVVWSQHPSSFRRKRRFRLVPNESTREL
jgi:hypothetical protein